MRRFYLFINLSLAVKWKQEMKKIFIESYKMQSTMQQLMKRRMIFLLLLDGRCIDARFNQQIGIVVYYWGEAVARYLRVFVPRITLLARGEIQFVFNFILNNALFDYPSRLTRPASSRLINASDSTWRSPAIRFTIPYTRSSGEPINYSNAELNFVEISLLLEKFETIIETKKIRSKNHACFHFKSSRWRNCGNFELFCFLFVRIIRRGKVDSLALLSPSSRHSAV